MDVKRHLDMALVIQIILPLYTMLIWLIIDFHMCLKLFHLGVFLLCCLCIFKMILLLSSKMDKIITRLHEILFI